MSDLLNPCERWSEPISLAAAGCLSELEEQDVRQHLSTCSPCREHFRQLSEVCRLLSDAAVTTENDASIVAGRITSAVAADLLLQLDAQTGKEMIHSTQLSHPCDTRSWIMRLPVSLISAIAVLVLAAGSLTVWLQGGGVPLASADLIQPILNAKTVSFKSTVEVDGKSMTSKVLAISSLQRVRLEQDLPNNQKMVTISHEGGSLTLLSDKKLAIVTTVANAPKKNSSKILFFELQSQLAESGNQSDWLREPLGEKEFDGRKLIGFRLTGHGMICDLWGDPKTKMPVRIENRSPSTPNQKAAVLTDFVFNADLDESLFSIEPPADYQVQKQSLDATPANEQDLIETFRSYTQLSNGAFPDQLDFAAIAKIFQDDWSKKHPLNGRAMTQEERQEQLSAAIKFSRGIAFVFEQLPQDAEAHYAGKGIKIGSVTTPVFWYRTTDTKKYRVLFADLSFREADSKPNVPNAQPISSASGRKTAF